MNLRNNFPPAINASELDSELFNLQKEIDEVELNLKSNYNSMIINILEFKPQLERYLYLLKDSGQKISFLLNANKDNKSIQDKLLILKTKLDNNRNQISLLLQMHELKSKVHLKK